MNKNIIYSIACMTFTIMIGGAVYEHLTVVPKWTAAPPLSLSMFQGEYGLKPDIFWMLIHPVNLVLFIVTILLNRDNQSRTNLWIPFIGYILVLAITSVYFVPELIMITTTPFSETVDAGLQQRAEMWEILSLVRLAFLLVLAGVIFMGLTKTANKIESKSSLRVGKRRQAVTA